MHGLTDAQVRELKRDLERELTRLRRSMGTTAEAARPVELDQATVGRLSRMDAMATQHMQKDLHARELALEGSILDALRRIEQRTYGRCATCGAAMPYGRLVVMPEARTCAGCRG